MKKISIISFVFVGLTFPLSACNVGPDYGQVQGAARSKTADNLPTLNTPKNSLNADQCLTDNDCNSNETLIGDRSKIGMTGGFYLLGNKTSYCAKPQGACKSQGVCRALNKQSLCDGSYKPLLGCDGQEYQNPCQAGNAGMNVDVPYYWPNEISNKNSDKWLVDNHDQIRVMYPKVLVLVFTNYNEPEDCPNQNTKYADWEADTEQLIHTLKLSTTFQGHKIQGPGAPAPEPFLRYEVAKYANLQDNDCTPSGNSSHYPMIPDAGRNFDYNRLYDPDFAELYGFEDPDNPGQYLDLEALLNRGLVNELWFHAKHWEDHGQPHETIEYKQFYDDNFKKIDGLYGSAGNGWHTNMYWPGRSLRILFINTHRGVGCALESLGHSMEFMAHSGFSSYYQYYFHEFGGFDLPERWGLDFNSFYGGSDLDYPTPDTLVWNKNNDSGVVFGYYAVGGNVHWMPNGRFGYDLLSDKPVYFTAEHYRQFDGPDGQDKRTIFTIDKIKPYKDVAQDCMGRWLVYWRQNMPSYDSPSIDDEGNQMKNWMPFLFY